LIRHTKRFLRRLKNNENFTTFSRCGKCYSERWIHRGDLDYQDAHLYARECLDCERLEWWAVPGDMGRQDKLETVLVFWRE
jgi:hypothetical protein